jgi:hypothetical protein
MFEGVVTQNYLQAQYQGEFWGVGAGLWEVKGSDPNGTNLSPFITLSPTAFSQASHALGRLKVGMVSVVV